jgi:hypothetical protein
VDLGTVCVNQAKGLTSTPPRSAPSRKAPVGLVFEQLLVYTSPKESTMRFQLFFIAFLAVVSAPQGALANPAAVVMVQNTNSSAVTYWPSSNAAHRAIFCGDPDTQTGFEYSTALNGALSQLTRSGRSLPQAMDILRARARCPAGRELPDLESKGAPVVTPSLIGSRP